MDCDGQWRESRVDAGECRRGIENDDGRLQCAHGGNWRGGRVSASYLGSCRDLRQDGPDDPGSLPGPAPQMARQPDRRAQLACVQRYGLQIGEYGAGLRGKTPQAVKTQHGSAGTVFNQRTQRNAGNTEGLRRPITPPRFGFDRRRKSIEDDAHHATRRVPPRSPLLGYTPRRSSSAPNSR
jgi:hypothetical protein